MLTSHRALLSALPVMLSLSPTRGLGVTFLAHPLSSLTRTRRRKLSQLIRPSLQPKAGPTRSEVIYLPLRLQPLLTQRLTSCLLLYPYSHTQSGECSTPDCRTNHSDCPFIGSESYKRLVSLFGKREMIPKFSDLREIRRLANEPSSSSSSTSAPKKPFVKKDRKNRGTVMTTILANKLPIPTSPNLISVFLTFSSQAEPQRRINVEGLLNTGCLAGDFVTRKIVEKYNIQPIL